MELLIVFGWLISLTTGAKTTTFQLDYSLCVSDVPCRCRRDNEQRLIVDCSNLNLTNIPVMPNDTVFLSLRGNEILEVKNMTFTNLPRLLSIDLGHNNIRKIMRDGFQGLENLRYLNLNSNNFPLTVSGLEPGVFRSLQNLCFLTIQNLDAHIDKSSYPHEIFDGLVSLTSLLIDGKRNAIFGPGFLKLSNLRMLTLSSYRCRTEKIFNNTFANLPFLTRLDISMCLIIRIEPGALIPLRHLQYLDISDNLYLGFDGLRNASFGLINSSITILKANKLYLPNHLSVQLKNKHVKFLKQTNLKQLYLDYNGIEKIESLEFKSFPKSIEKVSLSGNRLSCGLYFNYAVSCYDGKMFKNGSPRLTHKTFSSTSKAPYLRKNIQDFRFVTDLEGLKCDTNRTNCADNNNEEHIWDFLSCYNIFDDHRYTSHFNSILPTKQSTSLPKVNGKHQNTNAAYDNTDSSGAIFPIFVTPSLEKIDFQSADLRYEIPEINSKNRKSSVTFINVSGNSFHQILTPLVGLEKLKILDISDNLCSDISDRLFENVNQLESLFLGGNLLGFILAKDSDGRIFEKLKNLRILVLSNNQITSLPLQIFSGLQSLEYLDISRNYLQTFNIRMDQMKANHLIVSQNLLTSLPHNIRRQLTDQAHGKIITVDLTNNPFQCDCSTLEFIKWVQYEKKSRIQFVGFDNYTCNLNDNEQSFINLDNIILGFEKKCANYTLAIWILSFSFVLFIAVLTAGIMYRYRWKLRYLYYTTKRRYIGYNGLYENDRENYQFDAFISYADNNLRFVKFTLLPKVETEGLHLCIHHRDFLPGEEIAANIANAIHRSRKTVVLLDDDFLSSYWCMYELNMARMESVYSRNGENILILLIKEEMNKSKLPLELLDLIHKQTYIELPEDLGDIDASDICSRLKESIIN